MAVHLLGRFQYRRNMPKESPDILSSELKSFEKALSIIQAYITYTVRYSDPAWDDGVGIHLGRMLDKYLLLTMQEAGYEEREIDIFKTAVCAEVEKQGFSDYFVYETDDGTEDENVSKVIDFGDMPF